jgi:hypothetical protein
MDETVLMSDRQSRQGGIALQRIFFFLKESLTYPSPRGIFLGSENFSNDRAYLFRRQ